MAKITRINQRRFGDSGAAAYFGQLGSLPLGTKINTKDPTVMQSLAAFLDGIQSFVVGGTYKVALEDLNSLFFLAFYQIAYLMQAGVAEWEVGTIYYIGSIVNISGTLYTSLTDNNIGNNPVSSPSNWIVSSGVPIGGIVDFAGPIANIPAGYLVCDGSEISRTTYANLFAAIGTTWNIGGEAGTNFRLPDTRGKTTVGLNTLDSDLNAVGKLFGSKTNSHTHDDSHGHRLQGDGASPGAYVSNGDGGGGYTINQSPTVTGVPSDLNNMQPSAVMLKIIKF